MMSIHSKKDRLSVKWLFMGMAVLLLGACQGKFETVIQKHDPGDTVSMVLKKPKVLYVIVDGLRGQIIPQINPPTLTEMTTHAIYAYNGVSNDYNTDLSTWADMLTGVEPDKHQIKSNSFSGNDLADYPMFFTRLKEANKDFKTAAFCSSDDLKNHLIKNADVSKSFNGDDEAVKDAIIDELGKDSATVILGEFHQVQKAGEQDGYDKSDQGYVDAIMNFDGYMKEIWTAIKHRKDIKHENWLIIVASNKGGPATIPTADQDGTKFTEPKLNTFSIIYNADFNSRFIAKPNTANLPYTGNAIELRDAGKSSSNYGDAINAYVPDVDQYNFGKSGEYTVQIKVKVMDFGSIWPSFFGKRATSQNTGDPGWVFMFYKPQNEENAKFGWRLKFGSNDQTAVLPVGKDKWHTLTMKLYEENSERYVAIYTDGDKGNPVKVTGQNFSNSLPLTAGWLKGWIGTQSKLYITDIKIYDAALSDTYIDEHGGDIGVRENSPYYDDIIGFWPATDGYGYKYKDHSGYGNDMVLNVTDKNRDDFVWDKFSNFSGLLDVPVPKDIFKEVPRGVDMPLMIYKWMGLKINSFDLDGKFWLPD